MSVELVYYSGRPKKPSKVTNRQKAKKETFLTEKVEKRTAT